MYQFSKTRTRAIFFVFFLALAIPSIILSFQAHQHLRWQSLHQFRQVALELVRQIDSSLLTAIKKEEARADTDYTFFVLAGAPEARFVQRSELSKFPVTNDIEGLIGYFQVDGNGLFSSPVLPSEHVQSEVTPSLYGISQRENQLRLDLEKKLKQILAKNQLVESQPSLNDADDIDKGSLQEESEQTVSITGSRSKRANELDAKQDRKKESLKKQSSRAKAYESDKSNAFYSAIEKKRRQASKKSKQRPSQSTAPAYSQRKSRSEKNYSPQQSLADGQGNNKRLEPTDIKLRLFESQIEPFKFSQLESGHFVLYRQVWRDKERLVQGAIIETIPFIQGNIARIFEQSSLAEVAELKVFFGEQLIVSFNQQNKAYKLSSGQTLIGEPLSEISLSEPLSQFTLDFRVTNMPPAAGASFVILVASSLLIGLVIGTYFLYRLALKQSFLVRQQQDFVSSVSHELKTPLTSIRMYGEILKQGWVSEEKKMEYYDYIYSESERLSRLISNVLQISGMNHNALELKQESASPTELANLIQSKVDSQIKQSGFDLLLTVEPNISDASISLDKDAFIQIIINLVDNAIKYANTASRKQVDIRFEQISSEEVSVSVRDYGPGIEKTHIKRIFDLFYRSGDEMTREVKGTGIGLALVKELVTGMSAKIKAKNKQQGVEFVIIFNCSKIVKLSS